MPTIRTTGSGSGRRIITKTVNGQRRVSCSCCEAPLCCMYPAEQLGVSYFGADLPDEARVFYSLVTNDGTITLINNEIFPKNGNKYESPTSSMELFVQDGLIWRLEGTVIHPEYGEVYITSGRGCLFVEEYPFQTPTEGEQANTSITDQFKDSYTVNTYDDFIEESPISSFTINRIGLCEWTGFDSRYNDGTGVSLLYSTPSPIVPNSSMWAIQGNGRVDLGPNKSPVGTYVDGNYIWNVVE